MAYGGLAGCGPAGVDGVPLDFTEQDVQEANWDPVTTPERWVKMATSDADLEALLAETAVPQAEWSESVSATVPHLPSGQTALLYYVGGRWEMEEYQTTGIYASGSEWIVAVRKFNSALGAGATAWLWTRYLVFVDAAAPERVRLRFEDETVEGDPEVTWW